MHLFLTSVLPFLAHDHASAAAFLTCRHHNFHGSIIPEFLSDEERIRKFCEARQQNRITICWAENNIQYTKLNNLFVQTPLMQFSPSLLLHHKDCSESILRALLETKYFTRSLQRCSVLSRFTLTNDLLRSLSKVRSLAKLDLGWYPIEKEHLEIIVDTFPSLETLTISDINFVDPTTAISIASPPPPATKKLRCLELFRVSTFFTAQFIPHCPNLRKLMLSTVGQRQLDLLVLSSSLPLLSDVELHYVDLKNTESLKNLVHLSSLLFVKCSVPDLKFLTRENSLPKLTTLSLVYCEGLPSSSFASLSHAPNFQVLGVGRTEFDTECLQYLEDMIHLRKLDLSNSNIVGNSRLLKTLMQNLFQLEELSFGGCRGIGNQGAIAGALYSTHSRLRVLNLNDCDLVDDDLNGIGALKNTLEVLHLSDNYGLTTAALMHCKDLVKLKKLHLRTCLRIDDLSPLKDCVNLEELEVSLSQGLTDDSFGVFSEEPNSFPTLRVLELSYCEKLTEKVFEHLVKNNNLVYQLKELSVKGIPRVFSSSTARNNICQFKGLRRLVGLLSELESESDQNEVRSELMKRLRNLEEIYRF